MAKGFLLGLRLYLSPRLQYLGTTPTSLDVPGYHTCNPPGTDYLRDSRPLPDPGPQYSPNLHSRTISHSYRDHP